MMSVAELQGVQERIFHLSGNRQLAAQVWLKPGAPVYLALHGWLDNSASFSRLAPALNATVIALDLAGHGHSYHRSQPGPYHLWDDLLDLDEVLNELQLPRVGLLGHSRGAIIATLYAASRPEKVGRLLLVDGMFPEPVESEATPDQLRRALDEFPRHAQRRFPVYRDLAAAARVRLEGMFPLSEAAAALMVARGTRAVDGGLSWRVDPKLMAPSMIKLTGAQMQAFIARLSMPVTLILASEGMLKLWPAMSAMLSQLAPLEVLQMQGSHHLHLEQQAPLLAELFNQRMALDG